MSITHAFVSEREDGDDATLVKPSDWNAVHVGKTTNDNLWVPGSDPYGLDDEFDNASIDASWIFVDPSPVRATWTERADVLSCYISAGGGVGQYNAIMKSLGGRSFPITVETAFRWMTPYAYQNLMVGICLANGATWGSGVSISTEGYTANDYATAMHTRLHTCATGYNSDSTSYGATSVQMSSPVYFHKIVWSAANTFSMYVSPDGVSWWAIVTNQAITLTPTHIGLTTSGWSGGTPTIASFEYFRVY